MSHFKFGLSHCIYRPAWAVKWLAAGGRAPREHCVAVVYADWLAAQAPSPAEVLAAAEAHGAGVALVDTWDKAAGDLLAHWSVDEVHRFASAARQRGLAAAVAGSLTLESIARLLPGPIDWIAVRGAACRSGRSGAIDLARVRRLARLVHGSADDQGASQQAELVAVEAQT